MGHGASLPDAERAYYRWRSLNPALSEDPLAAFVAGVRVGTHNAVDYSARWVGLEPLLQDLLDELVRLRVEREWDAV